MPQFTFNNDDTKILIMMGFKIEVDSNNNQIAIYDCGYQHYIKLSKQFTTTPFTPQTVIHVNTINRQGYVVDNTVYDSSKLTKTIAVKIKNLILLLHKVELGNVVSMII